MPSSIHPTRCGRIARFAVLLVFLFAVNDSRAQQVALALQRPSAVVYDSAGNLYFAERAAHTVHRLAPDGTLTLVAGTGTQGFAGDGDLAIAAELDSPRGLAMDSAGNLYVADTRNERIRRVSPAGVITTIAGTGKAGFSGDSGPAASATLNLPGALAADGAGNVFVADARNHRIRRIAAATGVITTVAGSGVQGLAGDNGPATAAALDSPDGLAVDAGGNLYLADTRNGRIRRVDATTGTIATVAGTGGGKPGLAAESGDNGPAAKAMLALPRGLAIDAGGDVYLADSADNRVRRIAPDGTIAVVAGQGTEAFAGDGGAASAASLDAPGAVALAPTGELVVADGDNARLRQVSGISTAAAQIVTLVGPGAKVTGVSAGALSLTGPASAQYGSGTTWTAALASGVNATGAVTFVDTAGGTAAALGSVNLLDGSATLNTAALPAGTHIIVASYAGDATHAAAQSQALAITVAPLPVSAAAQPVTIEYGQAVPGISGTLTGVLAADAGKVSEVFSSFAGALSPAGFYPVTATLGGSAAGNYTLMSTTGSLTISRAPVTVAVIPSAASVASGSPVGVTVQVLSTTAGTPSGSVTLWDGTSLLGPVALSSGMAAYSAPSLGDGSHTLTATYSGDANFLPAAAGSAAVVTVGSAADFTFAVSNGATQAVPSGSPAAFTFNINGQGAALSSPITLAVSGLPVGVTASFNPAYIPPGGVVTSFTLTVLTTKTLAEAEGGRLRPGTGAGLAVAFCAPLVLFLNGTGGRRRRLRRFSRLFLQRRTIFAVLACITSATLASGCASRVNNASEAQNAPTYTLTVTGTATSATGTVLQHAVTVTLQVL